MAGVGSIELVLANVLGYTIGGGSTAGTSGPGTSGSGTSGSGTAGSGTAGSGSPAVVDDTMHAKSALATNWIIPESAWDKMATGFSPTKHTDAMVFWRWQGARDGTNHVEWITVWFGQKGKDAGGPTNKSDPTQSSEGNPLWTFAKAWAGVDKHIPQLAGPNTQFDPATLGEVQRALEHIGYFAQDVFAKLDNDIVALDTKKEKFSGSAAAAFRERVLGAERGVADVDAHHRKFGQALAGAQAAADKFVKALLNDHTYWRTGVDPTGRPPLGGPAGVWTSPARLIVSMLNDSRFMYRPADGATATNMSRGQNWESGDMPGGNQRSTKGMGTMVMVPPPWLKIPETDVFRAEQWWATDVVLRKLWVDNVLAAFAPTVAAAGEMVKALNTATPLVRIFPMGPVPPPGPKGSVTPPPLNIPGLDETLKKLNENGNKNAEAIAKMINDANKNSNDALNGINKNINDVNKNSNDALNGINKNINDSNKSIGDAFNGINKNIGDVGNGIGGGLDGLNKNLGDVGKGIGGGLDGLNKNLGDLGSGIGGGLDGLNKNMGDLGSGIGGGLDGLNKNLGDLGSGLGDLGSGLGGLGGGLGDGTGGLGPDGTGGPGIGGVLAPGLAGGLGTSGLGGPGLGASGLGSSGLGGSRPQSLGDLTPEQLGELQRQGMLDGIALTPEQRAALEEAGLPAGAGQDLGDLTPQQLEALDRAGLLDGLQLDDAQAGALERAGLLDPGLPDDLGDLTPQQLAGLDRAGLLDNVPVTPEMLDQLRQDGLLGPNAAGIDSLGDLSAAQLEALQDAGMLDTIGLTPQQLGQLGLSGLPGADGLAGGLGDGIGSSAFPTTIDGIDVTPSGGLASGPGVSLGDVSRPGTGAVPGFGNGAGGGFGTGGVFPGAAVPGPHAPDAGAAFGLSPDTTGASGAPGAGANGTGGMPFMPMMPPMGGGMGAPGGGQGRGRERNTWLTEDEEVWGTDPECAPAVVGRGAGPAQDDEQGQDAPARPGPRPGQPRRGRG